MLFPWHALCLSICSEVYPSWLTPWGYKSGLGVCSYLVSFWIFNRCNSRRIQVFWMLPPSNVFLKIRYNGRDWLHSHRTLDKIGLVQGTCLHLSLTLLILRIQNQLWCRQLLLVEMVHHLEVQWYTMTETTGSTLFVSVCPGSTFFSSSVTPT